MKDKQMLLEMLLELKTKGVAVYFDQLSTAIMEVCANQAQLWTR